MDNYSLGGGLDIDIGCYKLSRVYVRFMWLILNYFVRNEIVIYFKV